MNLRTGKIFALLEDRQFNQAAILMAEQGAFAPDSKGNTLLHYLIATGMCQAACYALHYMTLEEINHPNRWNLTARDFTRPININDTPAAFDIMCEALDGRVACLEADELDDLVEMHVAPKRRVSL